MKIIFSLLILSAMFLPSPPQPLFPKLRKYVKSIEKNLENLPEERKERLLRIAQYIVEKQKKGEKTEIIVICTHNSRRSHLGQVWLQIAAHYYGLSNIDTFSGGTEATACNIRTVKALQRAGLEIKNVSGEAEKNPKYIAKYANQAPEMWLFSKVYTSTTNPQAGFLAILVCDTADEACPIVKGAEQRIYHGYEDPKKSDDTPQETQTYDERCRQVAQEMFFVMREVKKASKK
ncbi:MAG: protein-tyrosine-phosphatase [Raineya sp.]